MEGALAGHHPFFVPLKWSLFLYWSGLLHLTQDYSQNWRPSLPWHKIPFTFCVHLREIRRQRKREMTMKMSCVQSTSPSSFSVKMKKQLYLVPGCRPAFEGVWGGIHGNKLIVTTNAVQSVFVDAWNLWGEKHVRSLIFYFSKERTFGFVACCHLFTVEHLSEEHFWGNAENGRLYVPGESSMWSDHKTNALFWASTNWYLKVIKPCGLFELWLFDNLQADWTHHTVVYCSISYAVICLTSRNCQFKTTL